jgi:hypothetical protein
MHLFQFKYFSCGFADSGFRKRIEAFPEADPDLDTGFLIPKMEKNMGVKQNVNLKKKCCFDLHKGQFSCSRKRL